MRHARASSPVPFAPLLLLALGFAGGVRAENIDPAGVDRQYAWSENAGWINAEPNGNGGPGVQVNDFDLTGWMWGENLGWISLSCTNTSSCPSNDYGVRNDSFGVLSGFAWSENGGWINFSPTTGGVTIDPVSGDFGGFAWGENVGWISFSCVTTGSCASVDYRVATGWQCTTSPPSSVPVLTLAKSGPDTVLSWPSVPAAGRYDVVRGSLGTLRSSGGDFTTATGACVADDQPATSVISAGSPSPGGGFWFLMRGVNCGGAGTYDDGGSQSGSRNAEIAASSAGCP